MRFKKLVAIEPVSLIPSAEMELYTLADEVKLYDDIPTSDEEIAARVGDADAVYDHLIGEGIIVRNRTRVRGCEGCLRITVGLKEENEKLIKSLKRYEESIVR